MDGSHGPHTKEPFTPPHSTTGASPYTCAQDLPTVFLLINYLTWILTSKYNAGVSTFSLRGATIRVGFQSYEVDATFTWDPTFLKCVVGQEAWLDCGPRGLGLDTPSQSPQSAADQPFNLILYIINNLIYGFPNRVKARHYVAMGETFAMWKFKSDVVIKT